MCVERRIVPLVIAGALALGAGFGCGGDSTGPSAASVTGIAGDNQIAPTGVQLEFPLSFVVLGTNGSPLPGITVNWTVQSGSAFLNPTTSTTDASGVASTTVTMGNVVGQVLIHATVVGLAQPVAFRAEAVDPCSVLYAYTFGATVSGSLTTTDCNVQGFYTDFFLVTLPTGQQSIRISMNSTAVDAYVELYRSDGTFVGAHDDSVPGVHKNSRLDVIVTGGAYVIAPSSFDQGETGAYTMSTATRPATVAGCRDVWIERGVTIADVVQTTDCADTAGGTDYFDYVLISAQAGSVLSAAQRSAEFNTKLRIANAFTGAIVAENDDSAGTTTNSFVSYAVATSSLYAILIGTSANGETGAYTLEVLASTGAPAPPVLGGGWDGSGLRAVLGGPRLAKRWQPLPGGQRSH